MTRKDYGLIALAVEAAMPDDPDAEPRWSDAVEQVAHNLASALAQDNPRFNRDKFLQACGVV